MSDKSSEYANRVVSTQLFSAQEIETIQSCLVNILREALTYPERLECDLKPLDFVSLGQIRFLPLERKAFPCYDLALTAAELGDNYPCALNGAGEIAVGAFLKERIGFLQIAETIDYALKKTERAKATSYDVLQETDARARAYAKEYIESIAKKGL